MFGFSFFSLVIAKNGGISSRVRPTIIRFGHIDDDDDKEVDDAIVVEESRENNNDESEYNYNHVVYQDSQRYDSENLSLEDLFDNDGLTQDSCFEFSFKENREVMANRTKPLSEVENGAFGESQNEEAMKSRVNEIQNEGVEEVKIEDLKCVFDLNEVPIEGCK